MASIYTKVYNRFRGVDFSTDPALVDDSRSPWAVNMVSDDGGMPEKRLGWRVVKQFSGDPAPEIKGIFSATFSGVRKMLYHVGDSFYIDDAETAAYTCATTTEKSTAVWLSGKLWIFTGAKLLCWDGGTVTAAEDSAKVPLVMISCNPDGSGGTDLENINLLSARQKISFLGDSSSTQYVLPYRGIDSVVQVEVDGTELSTGWSLTKNPQGGGNDYVTFTSAHPTQVTGEDNVVITIQKTISGYTDRINKCRIAICWGAGGMEDRIVCAGNPDYPNQDWISAYDDPTYFPDQGYAVVGSSQTAIVGYRRRGESLAIIKEDNGQDSTVFFRTGTLKDNGVVSFSVFPALAGVGGISRFGFGNIDDEQLILTSNGIYALTVNSITAEKIAQNRSYRIDSRLTKENLAAAVCISHGTRFYVFVGGHVYILDGLQPKSYPEKYDTTYLYEAFYWEDVPANCAAKIQTATGEAIFFGMTDGKVCRFNSDIEGLSRFSDGGTEANGIVSGGSRIVAIWSTKSDDDGDPMILKTCLKKGNAVTIKPYLRSSAKVLMRTDRDSEAKQVTQQNMDIFSWEDIDWARFTFNTNDAPQEVPIGRKVKNYKRLQFVIKNDALNEGFGVFGVVKHYVKGNFAKR